MINGLKRTLAALAVVALVACSSDNVRPAAPAQAALLADAEAMLARADGARADALAPEPLLSARRHLTSARALLYRGSGEAVELTAAETARVQRLADAALLDARLALVRAETQTLRAQRADGDAAPLRSGGQSQ